MTNEYVISYFTGHANIFNIEVGDENKENKWYFFQLILEKFKIFLVKQLVSTIIT